VASGEVAEELPRILLEISMHLRLTVRSMLTREALITHQRRDQWYCLGHRTSGKSKKETG